MTNVKLILLILMPLWLSLASEVSYGRHAAILIDADNGSILHEVDATHAWYPASLTKVMTLYMTFAALTQGQIRLNDTLTASRHAARQPNSKLGLRAGESITVEEAILALVTRSANDAAVVLAEHLGGNEENFAAKMTAKAHAIGMYDTHFMNATGLPHQWQVTTPRDLGLLAWKTLRDFPAFYRYFSAHQFYFRGRELRAINKFTASYPGAEGMKTGFTCGSGYNLMSTAQQNGKRLIGVVLGGTTSAERYQLMTNMMNNGFADKFNADHDKHISAIPAKYAGTAPYQLNCGKGASTTTLAHHATETRHSKTRYIKAKHSKAGKSFKVAKLRSGKTGKKLSHASLLSKNKNTRKTKVVSNKLSKSRYHRS